MCSDIFESALNSRGDFAGVFEYDGDTGYFYLYKKFDETQGKINADLHVFSGQPGFTANDVKIVWSENEQLVGLYILEKLWAVFDISGSKYGGNYSCQGIPNIPAPVMSKFDSYKR